VNEAEKRTDQSTCTSSINTDDLKLCKDQLSFEIINQEGYYFYTIEIEVPATIVDSVFEAAVTGQAESIDSAGFKKNNAPLDYIKTAYKNTIINYTKEFLLKFCVFDFLYEKLIVYKLFSANDPQLVSIYIEPGKPGIFKFELNSTAPIQFFDWKYFVFKAPRRKNYKDIDRQVDSFLNEELSNFSNTKNKLTTTFFDWVYFSVQTLKGSLTTSFWLQLSDEEIATPLRELFLEKSIGQQFATENNGLEEYLSNGLITNIPFLVTIHDIVPHAYFCIDLFKNFFKIKTQKDVHKKLIEVFSYRNDMSQRRAMVEESLELLRLKHTINVPNHLILRQKSRILNVVQKNPDYNVYKRHAHFEDYLHRLAYKQASEIVLVDQIAYAENIQVTHADIKGYLNLLKRNRTKEFIYFELPESQKNGQAIPVVLGQIKQSCLREKTVNYIIYHLTKK
jgi:FKBP-type peptidyl-prolyl cis-trans isomerase (trigger factor)